MEELSKNEVTLLTLPRSDVGLPMPHNNDDDNDDDAPTSHQNIYPSLLLLQLPPDYKVDDLIDVRFVIPEQKASLVIENRDTSFQLQRVETSNSLVLVPPPNHYDHGDDRLKRRKVTDKGVCLQTVPARLLKRGSGAFFLEAKSVPLPLADLQARLPIWDPYEADHHHQSPPTGPGMEMLGNALARSRAEVYKGLQELQALRLHQKESNQIFFCRLAEEARLDVLDAVLATLVEAFPHYASDGVVVKDFVESARIRLPLVLQRDHADPVALIQHSMSTLMSKPVQKDWQEEEATLQLDVTKVGVAVALRILTRQTIWDEDLFLARWQSEMPGVDTAVSTEWLRGHAVRISDVTIEPDASTRTTFYWKYLPATVVAQAEDAALVWERLVAAKPEWTAIALGPYLETWQQYKGQPSSTILCHAAVSIKGDLKIYHAP